MKLYFHFENKGPFQGIKYISYLNFMKFDRNIKTRTVELCSSQYLGYNFILKILFEQPHTIKKRTFSRFPVNMSKYEYLILRQCLLLTVLYLVPGCLRGKEKWRAKADFFCTQSLFHFVLT